MGGGDKTIFTWGGTGLHGGGLGSHGGESPPIPPTLGNPGEYGRNKLLIVKDRFSGLLRVYSLPDLSIKVQQEAI